MLGDHALVTWEKAQERFGYELNDQEFIENLINEASSILESEVGGYIVARHRTVLLSGSGRQLLILPDYPIVEEPLVLVDSARLFGLGTEFTNFVTDSTAGTLYVDHVWPKGVNNIKVTFKSGLSPLPDEWQDACLRMVGKAFADFRQHRLGIKASTGMDGQRNEYEIGIPLDVYKLIAKNKRVVV